MCFCLCTCFQFFGVYSKESNCWDHWAIPCVAFWGITKLFSTMAVPDYITISNIWVFQILYNFSNSCSFLCEMWCVTSLCLWLLFPSKLMLLNICLWLFVYFLCKKTNSSNLPIFKLGVYLFVVEFIFCWWVRVLCIFWMLEYY